MPGTLTFFIFYSFFSFFLIGWIFILFQSLVVVLVGLDSNTRTLRNKINQETLICVNKKLECELDRKKKMMHVDCRYISDWIILSCSTQISQQRKSTKVRLHQTKHTFFILGLCSSFFLSFDAVQKDDLLEQRNILMSLNWLMRL